MKNILIIDGGPRRNMNTAALCEAFAEGAKEVSPEIEVERVRLYDLPPYKGCMSCLACKLKDYSRYEFAPNTAETKQAYRDAHWKDDLAAARAAGCRMAEKIVL